MITGNSSNGLLKAGGPLTHNRPPTTDEEQEIRYVLTVGQDTRKEDFSSIVLYKHYEGLACFPRVLAGSSRTLVNSN